MSSRLKPTSMLKHDARKQSLYLPADMLEEIRSEAVRLNRSVSWVVQAAWEIARKTVMDFPSDPMFARRK